MFEDLPKLLDELCVKLGICLSPDDRARISVTAFRDLDSFEEAVLSAEGLNPLTVDRHLRHQLRTCIQRYVHY